MTILYGIKNCDTVKKARQWLTHSGIEHRFHDFRQDGLTKEHIQHWLTHTTVTRLVNKRSTTWKQLNADQQALFNGDSLNSEALEIIVNAPTLIKRPVLETSLTVHQGFKADDYAEILG